MAECKLGSVTISGGKSLSCLSPKDPPNFLPFAEASDLAHHHTDGVEDKYFLFSNESPIMVSTNGSGSKTFYAGVGLNTQFQRGVQIETCQIPVQKRPSCYGPLPDGVRVFTSSGYYIEGDLIEACVDECFEAMKKGVGIYYSPEAYRESLWEALIGAKSVEHKKIILAQMRHQSDLSILPKLLDFLEKETSPEIVKLMLRDFVDFLRRAKKFEDPEQYRVCLKRYVTILEDYLKEGKLELYNAIADALLSFPEPWEIYGAPGAQLLQFTDIGFDHNLIYRYLIPKSEQAGKLLDSIWSEKVAVQVSKVIGDPPLLPSGEVHPWTASLLYNPSSLRIEKMKKWIHSKHPGLLKEVLRGVSSEVNPLTEDVVKKLEQVQDKDVQEKLAEALGHVSEEWAGQVLKKLLNHPSENVQFRASLSFFGHPSRIAMEHRLERAEMMIVNHFPDEKVENNLWGLEDCPYEEPVLAMVKWLGRSDLSKSIRGEIEIKLAGITEPKRNGTVKAALEQLASQGVDGAHWILQQWAAPEITDEELWGPFGPFAPRKELETLQYALRSDAQMRNKIGYWLERDYADHATEYGGLFKKIGDRIIFKVYTPGNWGSNFEFHSSLAQMQSAEEEDTLFRGFHFHSLKGAGNMGPSHSDVPWGGDMGHYNSILIVRKHQRLFSVIWYDHQIGIVPLGDYEYAITKE